MPDEAIVCFVNDLKDERNDGGIIIVPGGRSIFEWHEFQDMPKFSRLDVDLGSPRPIKVIAVGAWLGEAVDTKNNLAVGVV